MVEEPLARGVKQIQLLGQEVHVVLVLPLPAWHGVEGEGPIARVVGRYVPTPGSEGADVEDGYGASRVDAA